MRPLHIGVLVETSRAYGRGVATGVIQYAREHGWILFPQESGLFLGLPPWLGRVKLDGIIALVFTQKIGDELRKLNVPVVDVYGYGHMPEAPTLGIDPDVTARLAAEFFTKAGFTRFAFCGYPGIQFSDQREAAFAKIISARGLACDCYDPPAKVRRCQDLFLRERGGMEYE